MPSIENIWKVVTIATHNTGYHGSLWIKSETMVIVTVETDP